MSEDPLREEIAKRMEQHSGSSFCDKMIRICQNG